MSTNKVLRRFNSTITKKQEDYILAQAKKNKVGKCEAHRMILDSIISQNTKKDG